MRLRFWKKKSQAPAKKPLANRSSRRKRIAGVLLAAAAGAYAGDARQGRTKVLTVDITSEIFSTQVLYFQRLRRSTLQESK
jgi:hypothetical protein